VKKKNQGRFRHVGSDHSLVSASVQERFSHTNVRHSSHGGQQITSVVEELLLTDSTARIFEEYALICSEGAATNIQKVVI
jgi:hypothetical protein